MLNTTVNEVPEAIKDCVDLRWKNSTIYNHFENPLDFMDSVLEYDGDNEKVLRLIEEGKEAFSKIDSLNLEYDKLYEDVAKKVKDKLIGRGFTTAMLYNTVDFTTENTGLMSKQRAMMGRRDCYFKNPSMTDGKLFHDIYINLSYSASLSDSTIINNSYAIYALTKELARLIPIRVFVVNHVGTDIPTCYSYVLKKFGQPLSPKHFLFFTSSSKRTFGWATYDILNKNNCDSTVGNPNNTVSISNFNLDKEIDTIVSKIKTQQPNLFKVA